MNILKIIKVQKRKTFCKYIVASLLKLNKYKKRLVFNYDSINLRSYYSMEEHWKFKQDGSAGSNERWKTNDHHHRDGHSQLLSDDLHNLLYFAQFIFWGARGSG